MSHKILTKGKVWWVFSTLVLAVSAACTRAAPQPVAPESPAVPAAVPVSRLGGPDTLVVLGTELLPYTHEDMAGRVVGLLPDILEATLGRRLGIQWNYQLFPWERAQRMVYSGEADAFAAAITPERSAKADPGSVALVPIVVRAYFLKTNSNMAHVHTKEDLRSLVGGAIIGNAWATQNFAQKGYLLFRATDMSNLIGMLGAGRIDYIPENGLILERYLADAHLLDASTSIEVGRTGLYLYINKSSPFEHLRADIDAAFRAFYASGEFENTLKPYLVR